MNLDRTFYDVIAAGPDGPFAVERSLHDKGSRSITVHDIVTGNGFCRDVLRVLAYNPVEGWSRDESEDIAREVAALANVDAQLIRRDLRDFIDAHCSVIEAA